MEDNPVLSGAADDAQAVAQDAPGDVVAPSGK